MNASPKSRRRWMRFSLRTMLVLVTMMCLYLGWAIHWKRQRHEFLKTHHIWVSEDSKSPLLAPWPLRWLGEVGIGYFDFYPGYTPADMTTAKSLFPESEIGVVPPAPPPIPTP